MSNNPNKTSEQKVLENELVILIASWKPSKADKARIREIKRQLKAMVPKPKMKRCAQCGERFDYDALVKSQPDDSSVVLFGYCSDKCYNKASKG